MEELLQTKSIPSLLVVIAMILCASFVKGIVEFAWGVIKHKQQVSDATVKELIKELEKTRIDIRRSFTALKIIAGEQWPEIRKEIMEDTRL